MDSVAKKSLDLQVKKERVDEGIKEFAETAMNELLGWYGYSNHREKPSDGSCKSHTNSNSSGPDSPKFAEGCGWCGKTVDESSGLSSGTAIFCTELCFSQSRRANFKKNKTCDWCRHVRHTVSYVDFQDGASQLQFCSDKCLNQYKMHIFCRETRAHLEMHPHMAPEDSSTSLITPDLWMKNCKSPTSRSPSPQLGEPQTSPLPLITVAHPSKLLASPSENRRNKPKRLRKRLPSTITNFTKIADSPQDLRVRQSPVHFETPELHPENPPPIPERTFFNYNQFPPDPRFFQRPIYHPHPNYQVPPMRPPSAILPPVTVMVPYPIVIPVPIPIPIPLPLSNFIKAAELKSKPEASHNGQPETMEDKSSQSNEEKEVEIVVDDVKETIVDPPPKPLRKRKKMVETNKAKIVLKSKKPLSV